MSGVETVSAKVSSEYENVGHNVSFGMGRGQTIAALCVGRGRPLPPGFNDSTDDHSVLRPTLAPAATSTPVAHTPSHPSQLIPAEVLGPMIADIARQIGEGIKASLATMHQPDSDPDHSCTDRPVSLNDVSQLKVVVQSETKAPPYFKGDKTDAFSIQEWEGMMKCYLSRMNCETHAERFDLIMSRLTGRARDIVKISLRCRLELVGDEKIAAVFDILKCNFSEMTYSSLPMKDFYSTVPRLGESAMDYWIRLNKSIDAADECLRRQGKQVEDPSTEVVTMFINHCPDPMLALSFQLKAPERWTAAEVQDRLDSHMWKMKSSANNSQHAMCLPALSQCHSNVTRHSQPVPQVSVSHAYEQAPVPSPLQLPVAATQPESPSSALVSQQPPASCPVPTTHNVHSPSAVSNTHAATSESQNMVAMFDKVLSLCTASIDNGQRRFHQPSRFRAQSGTQPTACRVCGSVEHSTHSHCRLYRLCLNCFNPGHVKRDCNQSSQKPAMPTPPSSNADLN